MMRWWWFGPQVTPAGLDRDLAAMKAAGLGGVEVQPVYPLALDGDDPATRTRPFLSPAFLDVLTHARATASDLGLRFDVTLGSGWPFGGPSVAASDAAGALRIEKVPVAAGATTIGLPMIGAGEALLAVYLTAGDVRAGESRGLHARCPSPTVPAVNCHSRQRRHRRTPPGSSSAAARA